MGEKSINPQASGTFLPVGKLLAIFGWLCLVFAGLIEGFAPGGANRPVVGAAILVVAAAIFIWTTRRWGKIFPGLCILAAFYATAAIFTGHALGPHTPMSHAQAAIAMVACGGGPRFSRPGSGRRILPRVGLTVLGR